MDWCAVGGALREGNLEERASWRLLQNQEDKGLACRSPAAASLQGRAVLACQLARLGGIEGQLPPLETLANHGMASHGLGIPALDAKAPDLCYKRFQNFPLVRFYI